MSETQFVVGLKLTADGKLVVTETGKAEKAVRSLGKSAKGAGADARKFGNDVETAANRTSIAARETDRLKSSLRGLAPVLGGVGAFELGRQMKNTVVVFRGYDQSLRVITGSTYAAGRATAEIRDTTKSLGLVNRDTIKSYIGLAAAAKGTKIEGEGVKDIFEAYLGSAVGLQRTNGQITRGFVALEQIISKGTVSMEEIRQQLADSLPGAVQISARAMGMTPRAFQDAVAAGEILSEDFIPKLAAQLRKEIPGGVASTNIAFNELTNSLDDARVAFGEGGLFELFSAGASTAAGSLDLLADHAEEIIAIGKVLTVIYGSRVAGAFVAGAAKSVAAQLQVNTALATGRAIAIDGARATEQRALASLNAARAIASETAATRANAAAGVATLRTNLSLIQSQRAQLLAEYQLQKGLATTTGRVTVLTKAKAQLNATLRAGIVTRKALAAAESELAVAQNAEAATAARASRAQLAHEAALKKTTVAARAATIASRTFGTTLAFLGGPVGVAILGTAGALALLSERSNAAKRRIEEQREETKRFREEVEALNKRLRENQQLTTAEENTRQRFLNAEINRLEAFLRRSQVALESDRNTLKIAIGAGDEDVIVETQRKLEFLNSKIAETQANIARLRKELVGDFGNTGGDDDEGLSADELKKLTKEYKSLRSSIDPAFAAQTKFKEASTTLRDALKAGLIPNSREYQRLVDELRSQVLPTTRDRIQELIEEMAEETRLLGLSNIEREVEITLRREQARAASEGREITALEAEEIRNLITAHREAVAVVEERKEAEERAAEEIKDIWREARRSVQDLASDQIFAGLNGELDSVKDVAEAFKNIWLRAYAEIAAAELFGDASGFFPGLSNFGFGANAANDNRNPTRVILDDSEGLGKVFSGLGDTINSFGANLGFARDQQSAEAFAAIGAGPTKTLTSAIGKLGQVAAYTYAAFEIGKGIGGMVGLGRRGGNALGGALAGLVFGGPIGAAIGATLGGLLTKTPQASALVSTSGAESVYTRGKGTEETANSLASGLAQALTTISQLSGSALSSGVQLGVLGQRDDEFFFNTSALSATKNSGKSKYGAQLFDTPDEAVLAAIEDAIRSGVFSGLSDTVTAIVNNSGASTVDSFLSDIQFAETFDQLANLGRVTSDFVAETIELNRQFSSAIIKAEELGLAEEELAAGRERFLTQRATDFNRETELAILEFTDPVRAALEKQADDARQYLLDAAAVGADLDQARRLVAVERDALIEDLSSATATALGAFKQSIDDFIYDVQYGDSSALSAQELLPQQLARFEQLLALAPTDESARAELLTVGSQVRETAIDAYASSSDRFAIEEFVLASLQGVSDQLAITDPVAVAAEIGAIENDPELIATMNSIGAEIAASNQDVVELLTDIRNAITSGGNTVAAQYPTFATGYRGNERYLHLR